MAVNFNLFTKTFTFPEEYAQYVRFLTGNGKNKSICIFSRNIDVYMMGAAVAINKDLIIDSIPMAQGEVAKISAEQFTGEARTLNYLYIIAMLNYKGDGYTEKDRIERAFRYPFQLTSETEPSEHVKKVVDSCMQVFNKYALAGTKYLYDSFKALENITNPTEEDFEDKMLDFAIQNLDITPEQLQSIALYDI